MEENLKKCSRCGETKTISSFHKDKSTKDGFRSYCKCCIKKYQEENKEQILRHRRDYYKKNTEKERSYNKKYFENNRKKCLEYNLEYYNNNKVEINKRKIIYNKEYRKLRRRVDSIFKLSTNIGSLIRQSIRNQGYSKNSKTNHILGCSYEQFKHYLEKQFTEGIIWSNFGLWHLDHIIPISSATNEEEVIALNHYTNFQPLWAEDNIKKSNKLDWKKSA